MLVFIALVTCGAFLMDNSDNQVAKAVETIKNFVNRSDNEALSALPDDRDFSIIKIEPNVLLDAPAVSQFPELPRGCEVTSLAMLLQAANVQVDKMTLAEQIKKDPTPFQISGGQIFFGNPHDGFVGSMYSYHEPGLGVYHEPIAQLAETYLPGKILDMTGSRFEELKIHLSDGRPVWVITNTRYKKLENSQFQTWNTPTGQVKVTAREHSVLITGYDQDFVYFNDPLSGEKNKKAPITDFEQAWVQMGSQAITFLSR
nr:MULTISPECIES: C39 family peptidase [Bacillus]